MNLSDVLLFVTVLFLAGHIGFDMRAIGKSVQQHKDFWWTVTTLLVLLGHLTLDFVSRA